MGRMYSISGFFQESFVGASPFGGYVIRGIEGRQGSDFFEGQLVDNYGPSRIEGIFQSEESIVFERYYTDGAFVGQGAVDYRFNFNEDSGLWFGSYMFEGSGRGNHAVCALESNFEGLNFQLQSNLSSDEWASNLIEDMVHEGMLKVVEGPEPD